MIRQTLVCALLLTACHETHQGGPSIALPDGGAPAGDGGQGADASAVDAGADGGGADAGGLVSCLPRTLLSFAPGDSPMGFVGTPGGQLWLTHMHLDPNPCDGECPAILEVGREGPGQLAPVYWSQTPGPVYVASDADRAVAFATARFATPSALEWQRLPRLREGWQRDGELALPEGARFVGAALGSGLTLFVALEDSEGELSVLRVDDEGATASEVELSFANGPREGTRLLSRGAQPNVPWLVSLQDWDFPPTVQIETAGSNEPGSFHGSSCGVDDYDVVDLGEDRVVVAQRCGSRIELHGRVALEGVTLVLTDNAAAVAPSIAGYGRNTVAVAYVEEGAASPTYEEHSFVDGAWRRVARSALPSDPQLSLPLVEVDIATSPWLVTGVAFRGTLREPGRFDRPEGRIARLGPCI